MDFPGCTDRSPTAQRQASRLSDDFMFGFDVEDSDDREYLADVAMNGMEHEDDIKKFVHLSLLRGVEEWEQAICCASAMKDRGYLCNSLDGQDVLSFLSKIYGVDDSCHLNNASSPPQRFKRPYVKKPKKTLKSSDAGIPFGLSAKKQRRAKRSKESPYWAEPFALVQKPEAQAGSRSETKVEKKTTPARYGRLLERPKHPGYTVPEELRSNCTVIQAVNDHEPTSTSPNGQHKWLGSTLFIDTTGPISQARDDVTAGAEGGASPAREKPDHPMIQDADADASVPGFEATGAGRQTSTFKADRTSNDNDDGDESKPVAPSERTSKRKAKSPYFATTNAASPGPNNKSPKKKKQKNSDNNNDNDNSKKEKKEKKKKRPPRGTVSSLPFPPLDATRFGLIQEELADDPFRLLIAVTFLIRTSGRAAIPVFRALVARYPTPADLASADAADVVAMIRHLGLGAVRAAALQRYARAWLETPPRGGVLHAVRNYPRDADGVGELDDDNDDGGGGVADVQTDRTGSSSSSSAWEIGHLTQGPYALDSWRIFCRDVLRGAASDWRGGGREGEFQPEWMRVLPRDKELRACLRWLWMREGWLWDPLTGDKTVLPDDLRRAVQLGRVGYDDAGNLRILDGDDDGDDDDNDGGSSGAAACLYSYRG